MSEDYLRLAKPKRQGIFGLIFSRLFLFIVLMVLQVLLYLALLLWLRQYLGYFAVIDFVFVLIMTLHLFSCDMDSSAKLTWLALIAIVPFLGTFLLCYSKTNFGYRQTTQRVKHLLTTTKNFLPQSKSTLTKLKKDPYCVPNLHQYLNRTGCFPIFEHTQVKYFPLGEEKFAAMLQELEKAKHFIFMEYFIIEEGYMWGKILEILARKAKEGVDVRVMYDGTCEFSLLPHDYPERLAKLGIKAQMFLPVVPLVSTHYNYRDHRKILVIDGQVAFNGGVNLADEYINKREVHGHWKDVALMIRGPAVANFTLMFLQMWNINQKQVDFQPSLVRAPADKQAQGFVMPFADCPLDDDKDGETVYIDILNRAQKYVHIMTPYLILDGELEAALKYAAERGVDVKLIMPGIPDKKLVYDLAKSYYYSLINAGVKIYEYEPGFVHAKVFVSDDVRAVVGTINLDYRSLYHHFECATYLHSVPCISDIEADFQATLSQCRQTSLETVKNEKWSTKIWGSLLRIVAPLM